MSELHDPRGRPGEGDLATLLLRASGGRETPPPELEARVRAAVEAHWRGRVDATPARPRWVVPLAAGVALCAAAALWWATGPRPAPSPAIATVVFVRGSAVAGAAETPPERRPALAVGGAVPAGSRLTTGDEALLALELDVGLSLRLAPATTVVWSRPGRLELERGGIYVDRAGTPPSGAGLEIDTPFGVVHEIGTQFDLTIDQRSLRARVREGAIALDAGGERHVAAAGVELVWSGERGVERGAIAANGEAWRWALEAAPPLALDGRTLDEVLRWLSREMGWRVEFEDPSLRSRLGAERVHGELTLQPRDAMELVLPLFGLAGRVEGDALVVSAADA
jgi:hypothetical protein